MANVKCPKCGELNKSLNLEETWDGTSVRNAVV